MKKKHNIRSFLTGAVCSLVLVSMVVTVGASVAGKSVMIYPGVNIYVDDKKLNPTDVNGNAVETFIYNGSTYLPVRAVSEALDKPVQWDGKTRSVYIGKHSSEYPAVLLKDLDYFTGKKYEVCKRDKDNLGNTYDFAITRSATNVYKLNEAYSKISGVFYQRYDYRSYKGVSTLEIYGDGRLLYSAEMKAGVEPIPFSVDLTGVLELKVVTDINMSIVNFLPHTPTSAIGDCALWT